jgi:hypothetical protein
MELGSDPPGYSDEEYSNEAYEDNVQSVIAQAKGSIKRSDSVLGADWRPPQRF